MKRIWFTQEGRTEERKGGRKGEGRKEGSREKFHRLAVVHA